MDDESETGRDEATTDFVGVQAAPITIVGSREFSGLRDDAPTDRPSAGERPTASDRSVSGESDGGGG